MAKPIRIFKQDMMTLRARGLTNAAIGRRLGCSKEYVRQVIGNSREINRARLDRLEQEICRLLQQDQMGAGDIAKRVGLARGSVYMILHKHGYYCINN